VAENLWNKRWGSDAFDRSARRVATRKRRVSRPRLDELEQRVVLTFGPASLTPVAINALQPLALPGGSANRVSTDLLLGYDRVEGMPVSTNLQGMDASSKAPLMTDAQGRVEANFTTGNATALAPILTSMGVNVVSVLPKYNQVEGYLPWSALPALSNLGSQGLMGIIGVERPIASVGTVTDEGVNVIQADRVAASTPGYNGAGITVGALSDSYNNVAAPSFGGKTGAAADELSGDLAPNVNVIQDISSGGTDEGRAILQIIHKVAPGASEAFATADVSEGGFASNIQALANAGAKVIDDDITYFDEPFFQPGIVGQAVNNVVTNNGVSYFSSAGNYDTQAYDTASSSSYGSNPLNFITDTIPGISSSPGSYFNFAATGTANDKMAFTIDGNQAIVASFEFDQPFYTTSGVTTNLDVYLLNSSGQVVAYSNDNNISLQEPFQFLGYQASATAQFDLVIQKVSGPTPGEIKFVNYGSNDYGDINFGTFATNSSTITPHAAEPTAMAVGAVPFFFQLTPETFSSFGPATFLFDASGNRLASPLTVAKPNIMAPDGVSTTFFGSSSNYNGFPNFFGTSAAAPHAAGAAALILQADPSDTPTQVYSALESTANPNVGTGAVNQVGNGLINVYTAIFGGPVPAFADTADGFETGVLGSQWQIYQSGAGRVQVSSDNGPSSGNYQLVLDGNLQGYYAAQLDEAILNVNLAGRKAVNFTFDHQFFNEFGSSVATVPAMPATFTGHNDSNGVAFSVDGTNWYRIESLASDTSLPYQTDSFNLSQIAAADGVTLGANTLIKFQESSNVSDNAPFLGLGIDNVKVSALSVLTQNQIDIGTVQRSVVRSLTLTFQGDVTTIPASAFSLVRSEDGLAFPVNVGAPVYMGGLTTVVLTWGGPNLNGTSLPDGRYTLSINGSLILDNFGNEVDAANNGTAGSTGTINFYRFFGDFLGTGVVNATDFLMFRTAYLTGNATGANSIYSYTGATTFSIIDLNAFTANFTKRTLT